MKCRKKYLYNNLFPKAIDINIQIDNLYNNSLQITCSGNMNTLQELVINLSRCLQLHRPVMTQKALKMETQSIFNFAFSKI